jgi:carbon storage regulator CsrA
MLVLSRRPGESIVIGGGIQVVVLDTNGGRVKLGVVAPTEVPVYREEIQRKFVGCQLPVVSSQTRCLPTCRRPLTVGRQPLITSP